MFVQSPKPARYKKDAIWQQDIIPSLSEVEGLDDGVQSKYECARSYVWPLI